MGLGLEFVEQKEVRDLKKKSEEVLEREWRSSMETFIEDYNEMKKTLDEKTTAKMFSDLGQTARHTVIASVMLEIISRTASQITKSALCSIGSILLLVATIWASLTYPTFWRASSQTPEYSWLAFTVMEIVILALFLRVTQNHWRDYNDLRSYFYELSEKPSLLKAQEIAAELRRKDIDIP